MLPLSGDSETGTCILIGGIGLNVFVCSFALVCLECELFSGEALLAVHSALPIEGISVILGNGLVGTHLWADIVKLDVLSGVDKEVDSKIIS